MKKIILNGQTFELTAEMLEKEEITLSNDELVIRTKEDDEKFQNNLKNESKKAGVEIAVKEARAKLGLEFEGKNIDKLIEAVQIKVLEDAKIEPEEKLKNALKDIDTLKGTIGTLTNEKDQTVKAFESYKTDLTIKDVLSKSLPDNLSLPKDDMILIIKNRMSFDTDEKGNVIVKDNNGEVIKNTTTLDPKPVNEVITLFFDENKSYLQNTAGGAGGSDSTTKGGKITIDKFIEDQRGKGIQVNSEVFVSNLAEAQKNGVVEID